MDKWIVIKEKFEEDIDSIDFLEEIIAVDENGRALVFDSVGEAEKWAKENLIGGAIIRVPIIK